MQRIFSNNVLDDFIYSYSVLFSPLRQPLFPIFPFIFGCNPIIGTSIVVMVVLVVVVVLDRVQNSIYDMHGTVSGYDIRKNGMSLDNHPGREE